MSTVHLRELVFQLLAWVFEAKSRLTGWDVMPYSYLRDCGTPHKQSPENIYFDSTPNPKEKVSIEFMSPFLATCFENKTKEKENKIY